METSTHPPEDSNWINLKKGTEYKVWKVVDDLQGKAFVIYQESDRPACTDAMYFVKHTEVDGLTGLCYREGDYEGNITWKIRWIADFTEDPDAWARPLSMWAQKFKPITP